MFILFVIIGLCVLVLRAVFNRHRRRLMLSVSESDLEGSLVDRSQILEIFNLRWPVKSFSRFVWWLKSWVYPEVAIQEFCFECAVRDFVVFTDAIGFVSPHLLRWVNGRSFGRSRVVASLFVTGYPV